MIDGAGSDLQIPSCWVGLADGVGAVILGLSKLAEH